MTSLINENYSLNDERLKGELDKIGATYTSSLSAINYKGYTFSYNKGLTLEENNSNIKLNFVDFPSLKYNVYSKDTNFNEFYTDDIIEQKEKEVTVTYYVDKDNGLDTNNGLSQTTAFKTLKKALSAYTSVKSGVVEILIIGTTTFYSDELYGELIANVPLIIKPLNNSDRVILNGGVQNVSWSKLEGEENIYSCNTNVEINGVINTNNKDDYGLYNGLTQVFSLSDCSSTDNSFYIDTSNNKTAYVNLGGQQPNDNILPVQKGYLLRFNHTTSTGDCGIYLKNIDTVGITIFASARGSFSSSNNNIEFVAEDCIFQHGFNSDLLSIGSYDVIYLVNCIAGYAYRDVFNYSGAYLSAAQKNNSIVCEVNCKIKEGGFYNNNTLGTNNLSTAHNGINILRLNTVGYNSEGPLITDVNGCRSILIECQVDNYKSNLLGKNCYVFNNESADKDGLITIVRCGGSDNRSDAIVLNSSCKTELIDFERTDSMSVEDYITKTFLEILI